MTPNAQHHQYHHDINNTPNANEQTPLLLSILFSGRPPHVETEDDEELTTTASTSSSSPLPYDSIHDHHHHRHSYNTDNDDENETQIMLPQRPPRQRPTSFWKFFYLSSIIIYVACNLVLLYINLSQTQDWIEEHCYLSFHLTSFWSTFLFALVEAVVIYHTTRRTTTNNNRNPNNNINILYNSRSPLLMMTMVLWNIGSTLGVAVLFTIDPLKYEHEAHILEYIIQIGISIIDMGVVVVILVLVVVVVPPPRTTSTAKSYSSLTGPPPPSNHHHDNYIPISEPILTEITNATYDRKRTTPSQYWNTTTTTTTTPNAYSIELVLLEFIIATCVLILAILTYVCYTTPDTDGWGGMTTTTIRQSMVQKLGGPEHAAHTIEFITEVLNGLFVIIFTYVSS